MEFKNIARELAEVGKNYDYQQPPDLLVKLQDLISYLLRQLKDLLSYLKMPQIGPSDNSTVATLLQLLVITAGIVAAVMILLLVASRLRTLQAQRNLAIGSLIISESELDSKGWMQLSAELEEKGNYREACRAVYMSVLHLLDERNVMAFSTTKTNYEYFYALKRVTKSAQSFRSLVDLVEYIWFGDKEATGEDLSQCRKQAQLMEEGLPLTVASKEGDVAVKAR